jgi:nitrogen fixation protein NifQ
MTSQPIRPETDAGVFFAGLSSEMTEENRLYFSKIIQAQLQGWATLPHGLGLDMPVYRNLLAATNNTALIAYDTERSNVKNSDFKQRSALIKELTAMKMAERNELVELLFHHARLETPFATQAAIVVATGCLSPMHLWKTLGFSNRSELYGFLNHNFPTLVEMNDKNMRWKRFFYLQLCQSGGDYVCRSPSCEACSSYRECFVTDA